MGIRDFSDVFGPLSIEPGNEIESVGIGEFEVMKVVGKGAFGKVYQVRKRGSLSFPDDGDEDDEKIYAMKVMRKDEIIKKGNVEYIMYERDVLMKVDHPFIVKLRYSFQTKYRLYIVLDFVNGGHLFFHLHQHGLFREDLARVYAAEIVSAVGYLHAIGIMHRDLKPENILLGADGHIKLTDFGVAKQFDDTTRANSMCGTTEYMSPEIILGKGHDKSADWWSFGILLYQMLTGKPPFIGGNKYKIQQKILKDKLKLPTFLSSEAHSLLKGLLQKEQSKRLGSGASGVEEIRSHKWFKPINWNKLERREIDPNFKPVVNGKQCLANISEEWTKMPIVDSPASTPKSGQKKDNLFEGFTFNNPHEIVV